MDSDAKQPELPTQVPAVIDSFRGDFGFLSNFYEASIWLDGQRYPSVEHAYQAMKADNLTSRKLIREAATPGIAKKLGRAVQLPPDWDTRKVPLMRMLIHAKFKNPLLRAMLLATGDAVLIEGNTWNDRFWGVCRGVGQNWLGRILVDERDGCRNEDLSDISP